MRIINKFILRDNEERESGEFNIFPGHTEGKRSKREQPVTYLMILLIDGGVGHGRMIRR